MKRAVVSYTTTEYDCFSAVLDMVLSIEDGMVEMHRVSRMCSGQNGLVVARFMDVL